MKPQFTARGVCIDAIVTNGGRIETDGRLVIKYGAEESCEMSIEADGVDVSVALSQDQRRMVREALGLVSDDQEGDHD